VDDVARAVLQLLDSDYTGTVNIGSGTMTRVSQVVEILRNLSGATIHDEDRPVEGPAEFRCDVSRLKSIVQWEPEYSIESGLRQTYETMRNWANEVPA
jgi:nucleoside-diphosphate-sugar epimerase